MHSSDIIEGLVIKDVAISVFQPFVKAVAMDLYHEQDNP